MGSCEFYPAVLFSGSYKNNASAQHTEKIGRPGRLGGSGEPRVFSWFPELVREQERKRHPGPQGWVPVPGPNFLSPTTLFLGQAKRNREHWFDELPRTAFLIFKGKADLDVAS